MTSEGENKKEKKRKSLNGDANNQREGSKTKEGAQNNQKDKIL